MINLSIITLKNFPRIKMESMGPDFGKLIYG